MNKPRGIDEEDWKDLQNALVNVSTPSFGIQPSQLYQSNPEQLGNDPKLEQEWAIQAIKHAQIYYKLLLHTQNKQKIRLTSIDDIIYEHFRQSFPSLVVTLLTDDMLKNKTAKDKWREFCMSYSNDPKIKDYNFGCLLRLNSEGDYENSENVTIVPKIQFYAIEIARNREGHNNTIANKQ